MDNEIMPKIVVYAKNYRQGQTRYNCGLVFADGGILSEKGMFTLEETAESAYSHLTFKTNNPAKQLKVEDIFNDIPQGERNNEDMRILSDKEFGRLIELISEKVKRGKK